MALNYRDQLALETVGLVDLMKKSRKFWFDKTKHAYDYTVQHVVPTSGRVRPDDVVQVLEPGLQVTTQLRTFLAEKKLREQYWYRRFGDLLLDTFWDELTAKGKEST